MTKPLRLPSVVLTAAILYTALALPSTAWAADDWPQWHGPLRNGIATDSPPLADQCPGKGPAKL